MKENETYLYSYIWWFYNIDNWQQRYSSDSSNYNL